jgi:RNAse (barnase) inhibitor barstar
LPSDAPKVGVDNDPEVVYPFAERLMKVNALAHKRIVTNAEYHDSDSGQRYFVAIVTSCKDLDALWSIKKGVLESEVEAPLRLKSDFEIFSFVEYFQQGQWGVGSCDGTT